MCEPDYERGDDDADVVEGVAHDVDEDAHDAEVHTRGFRRGGEVVVGCVVFMGGLVLHFGSFGNL